MTDHRDTAEGRSAFHSGPAGAAMAAVPVPAVAALVLDRLAADLAQQPAPPLSARARQALRPATAPARPRWWRLMVALGFGADAGPPVSGWRRAAAWGLSGAALCGVGVIGSVLLLVLSPPERAPTSARAGGPGGFITVASAERWQQLVGHDVSTAWVVPAELPRERLATLGLPFDPSRAGERVSAELLMHPSGEVLAVRVLAP